MRVAFNARILCAPTLRGWNRYTVNLLAELSAMGVELFLYTDRLLHEGHLARLPKGGYCVRVAPPMQYGWWEQRWMPRQCDEDRVNVLHTPFNFGLPWSSPCPRVLTLHDAIDHVYYSRQTTWRQRLSTCAMKTRLYHWIARTRAHQIITVSEHAKADLENSLGIPSKKISVIYEAADSRFHMPISSAMRVRVRESYRLPRPYVFYVGGWEKRKNVPFLMRAFAEANLNGVDLVLAGGEKEQQPELIRLADSLGVADRIHLFSWVDDSDLPTLYAEALCFVYPSEYEGFGLQLCEAMAVGSPTLAADTSCLPEILGNGGKTFSLISTEELSRLLHQIASDLDYRVELSMKAKRRGANFSWQQTAVKTFEIYQQALIGRRA
ncbi:MAG: glycosyltransferase family 4 protein, partial [Acidobacteria bacterium]|nr:glycosyltransferase family 4 protein [Acidobacteriota bacterium]